MSAARRSIPSLTPAEVARINVWHARACREGGPVEWSLHDAWCSLCAAGMAYGDRETCPEAAAALDRWIEASGTDRALVRDALLTLRAAYGRALLAEIDRTATPAE